MLALAVIPPDNGAMRKVLGRFEILEPTGAGGMGSVFRAFDPKLERHLAIKVVGGEWRPEPNSTLNLRELSPELDRRTAVLSHRANSPSIAGSDLTLLDEARAMAQLSHPNVVSVFEVGSAGDQLFIAMELVEGRNMRQWLAETDPPRPLILSAFQKAALGLGAAHQTGLVHRDFKPDNVLVGENGSIQVADFGLALSSDSKSHVSGGTPAYMAPELLEGEQPSAASDVYAFCVALVEALTGAAPRDFEDKDIDRIVRELGRLPKSLRNGIRRGLMADPSLRPQDGGELAKMFLSRRRIVVPAVGAALLAAGLGAAVAFAAANKNESSCSTWPRLNASWNNETAVAIEQRISGFDGPLAQDMAPRVVSTMTRRANRLSSIRRERCEAHERGEISSAVLATQLACADNALAGFEATAEYLVGAKKQELAKLAELAQPGDEASACAATLEPRALESAEASQVRRELQTIETEHRAGRTTIKGQKERLATLLQRSEADGNKAVIAETLLLLARANQDAADLETASTQLRRSIELARDVDDVTLADATIRLADIVGFDTERIEEAETLLSLADVTLAKLPNAHELRIAKHRAKSRLLAKQGRFAETQEELKKWISSIGPSSELRLRYERARAQGVLLMLQGKHAEAVKSQQERLAVRREQFGDHHPKVADALSTLSAALGFAGRDEEEIALRREEAEIYRAAGLVNAASQARLFLAMTFIKLEQYTRALPIVEKHVAFLRARTSPNPRKLVSALRQLCNVKLALGDVAGAQKAIDEASDLSSALSKSDGARTELALARARTALLAKDMVKAKKLFIAYRDLARKNKKASWWEASADAWLGYYYLQANEPARAIELYRLAIAKGRKFELITDRMRAPYRLSIGRALNDVGRPKEAIPELEAAQKAYKKGRSTEIAARFELGRAKYLIGDKTAGWQEAKAAKTELEATEGSHRLELPRMNQWLVNNE